MSNLILDKVIDIIKDNYISVSNSEIEEIPSIYYIGLQKTASASLLRSFPNNSVAHWHSVKYFESINDTVLLSSNNLDLYDLVLYIADKYKNKPLFIECLREPISRQISLAHQHIKWIRKNCNCSLCKWKWNKSDKNKNKNKLLEIIKKKICPDTYNTIYSIKMWKKHFNIDLYKLYNIKKKYYYNKLDNCKLLFIRFEDIKDRGKLFSSLGYTFKEKHINNSSLDSRIKEYFNYVNKNLYFNKEELDYIYNKFIKNFYNKESIDTFYKRYLIV